MSYCAPVIVYDNAAKDAINVKAASAFAKQTGQELQWYYAEDKHQKLIINGEHLRDYLTHLPSGQTQQRLGQIPLVLGMPVLISQNLDVEGGIVNGSRVTHIRYQTDSNGCRHLKSVIVNIDDIMGMLPPHHLPILTDSTEITFSHPFTKRKCRIQCTQVPVLPAFAMTAHRAQGQTLSNVIVDLQSCRGTEAPYVMISQY